MKKLLIILFVFVSFAFAKKSMSHEYAYVDYSEAIYETKHHYNKRHHSRNEYRSTYESSNHIGIDTLIGATIGVAVGNHMVKGKKAKGLARVAGGIIGASIANNSRDEYKVHHRDSSSDHKHYKKRKRKVLVGYKNYFVYDNKQYFKITLRPKNKIKITKTISF